MPELLDVLNAASVCATFFVLGRNIVEPCWSPAVTAVTARTMVVRAITDGHEIGNHSFSHEPDWSARAAFMTEVSSMDRLIHELRVEAGATGDGRTLVRLPYGEHPPDARADVLRTAGREPVHWTRICVDWQPREADELAREMMRHVGRLDRQGKTAVVALHASGESAAIGFERPWTVAAVRIFLEEAERRGWRSVACPQLCTPAMEWRLVA